MKKSLALALSVSLMAGSLIAQAQPNRKAGAAKKANPTPAKTPAANPKATLLTLGKNGVTVEEFLYVYKKNNTTAEDSLYLEKNLRDYLELYTNFKLKVIDAQNKGLDTTNSYKKELETYRKQLAQPYLTEKNVTEQLVKEAYKRMGTELNASHILLMVGPDASPEDTLKKFKEMQKIRQEALAGADFEELAKKRSEDPSAKQNGGNLGYFTALQMLYPFEDMAYKTPVGQISKIVRTRFGYHILKVNDKRPNQGQVKVAHIMIRYQSPSQGGNGTREDSIAAREKVNEIASRIKKGEPFDMLAQQFSDDQATKDKGGILPVFSSGQMIPAFEEKAFALKNTGDISEPFQTAYGFHIIKMLERKPMDKFEDMEQSLREKVKRDSRAEIGENALIARLKRENKFAEQPAINLNLALAKADTNIATGKWTFDDKAAMNSRPLFSIAGQDYNIGAFFSYFKKNQANHPSNDPKSTMKSCYKDFVNQSLKDHEEANLEKKYDDFRLLMREYREGILLFTLMDQKVWTKAVEDTAGLRKFFNSQNGKYRWNQRSRSTLYSCKDAETLNRVRGILANRPFEVFEPKFDALSYDKNLVATNAAGNLTIGYLADQLKRDASMTVSINGYQDLKEKKNLSLQRAQAVRDSLIKMGIAASRIAVKDMGKMKNQTPAEYQTVRLQTFSSSPKALERLLNTNAPLTLQVTEGAFQKGENKLVDGSPWQVGERTVIDNGRHVLIVTSAIENPRNKQLEECRGQAISDYQTELEKEWVKELRKQYSFGLDEAVLKSIVKTPVPAKK